MTDIEIIYHFLYDGVIEVACLVPVCVACSLLLGCAIGILQSVKLPVINQLLWAYIMLMRGLPPLLLLLIVFFVGGFDNEFTAAVVTLSTYHAAYIGDIIRGAIAALPRGQSEAADTLALRLDQKMASVIIPQAWRAALPSITGQYVILVKDTALVSAIGVMEILYNARQAMQQVDRPLLIYFLVGFLFFLFCYALERLEVWIKHRRDRNSYAFVTR